MLPRIQAVTRAMLRPGILIAVLAAIVAVAAPAYAQSGPSYYVTVNTAGLAGQSGYVAYELFPNAPDSPTLLTDNLNVAYSGDYSENDPGVFGFGDYTYSGGNPATGSIDNNQITGGSFIFVPVTFGSSFDVLSALSGTGFLSNAPDGSTFSIDLFDSSFNPLLNSTGDVFEEDISGSGGVSAVNGDPANVTDTLVPESSGLWLLLAGIAAFGFAALGRRRRIRLSGLRTPVVLLLIVLAACAFQQTAQAQAGTDGTLANNYLPWAYSSPAVTNTPTIGSTQPVEAAPAVPVPDTTPIAVPLFSGMQFANYNTNPFTYPGPPAGGPWAKIVLVLDFTENSGTQYDRSSFMWLGPALIYWGTTPEPSSTRSPNWEIQRDMTEYASLLSQPQSGGIYLGNTYEPPTYNGIPVGSAYLLFYPTDANNPAPTSPNEILTISPGEGVGTLSVPTDEQSNTLTFPTNMDKLYLETWAEQQIGDEFYWDDSITSSTPDAGMREIEVSIDGIQAGSASCFPWVFSGGDNPNYWLPQGDIQQYEFKPRLVDLTPFVGYLNDGNPHTIAFSIFDNDNYWNTAGNLLVYTDPVLPVVYGGLTVNTAAYPTPTITGPGVTVAGTTTVGNVENTTLDGYADTYLGWQETTVATNEAYSDALTTTANSRTGRISLSAISISDSRNITTTTNATFGSSTLVQNHVSGFTMGYSPIQSSISDRINDTYNGAPYYSASLSYSTGGASTTSSSQTYAFSDSLGNSWNESDASGSAHTITSVTYGSGNNFFNSFWSIGSIIPNDWLQTTNS